MGQETSGACVCKLSWSFKFRVFTPDWEHMNTEERQIVKTWIYQVVLEEFWPNILFPGNYILYCTFPTSCEGNRWILCVHFLLVELCLEGLSLKVVFASNHKLNSVSASGLELCKQTNPDVHFCWAGNWISQLGVCVQKWGFCLSVHVCIHARGQINIVRIRVHYQTLAPL